MNSGLSDLFIRRPVMTVLVMTSILLFGLIGYRQLAISDLPNVDFPTILVSANLPGASADTMASTVATVLEKQFATIAGARPVGWRLQDPLDIRQDAMAQFPANINLSSLDGSTGFKLSGAAAGDEIG